MGVVAYTFTCENGESYRHQVDLDADDNVQETHTNADLPDWTQLEFEQCDGCEWTQTNRCPVAVNVRDVVELLHKLPSHEKVYVTVDVEQRQYAKHCDVQEGLSGLIGLIMATSGCPAFKLFNGLAEFHLPFASFEETLFRNTSAHLVRHHFIEHSKKNEHDIVEDVKRTYDTINKVNRGFVDRIREGFVPQSDSASNAIVILDCMGTLVAMSVEQGIDQLKQRFANSD